MAGLIRRFSASNTGNSGNSATPAPTPNCTWTEAFRRAQRHGPWEWDGIRRAGVSSFGVGGTNAHVVLEERRRFRHRSQSPVRRCCCCCRSNRRGLAAVTIRAGRRIGRPTRSACPMSPTPSHAAGRKPPHGGGRKRPAGCGSDAGHGRHDNVFVGESVPSTDNSERVVFLFPGQGAQHIGMGRGLYESEPVFAEHFDQCAAGFGEELGIDLRAEVFDGTARNLERTDRTQPALFTVEYALAKLIETYGVRPAAVAGHSIGDMSLPPSRASSTSRRPSRRWRCGRA